MSLKVSAIAAMAKNRVIGANNQLPWRLPADLKRFKSLTTGHAIIMGRKTYQSIGKPLPNRRNIILTRDPEFQAEGIETATTPEQVLALVKNDKEVFIIGGAEIYQLFMPLTDRIYLTLLEQEVAGDAYFPEFDVGLFQETARETHEPDADNAYRYSFITLERNHI